MCVLTNLQDLIQLLELHFFNMRKLLAYFELVSFIFGKSNYLYRASYLFCCPSTNEFKINIKKFACCLKI